MTDETTQDKLNIFGGINRPQLRLIFLFLLWLSDLSDSIAAENNEQKKCR